MRRHPSIPAINARPFPLRCERVRILRISLQDTRNFLRPDLVYLEVNILHFTENHGFSGLCVRVQHTVFLASSRRQKQWQQTAR